MKFLTISVFAAVMLMLTGCNKTKANLTRGVSSKCEVHGSQMTKTSVPIAYGLIRLNAWGKALHTASSNSFPHAEDSVLGGCIVDTPTQAVIYVCPQCQTARQKWESEHPAPK